MSAEDEVVFEAASGLHGFNPCFLAQQKMAEATAMRTPPTVTAQIMAILLLEHSSVVVCPLTVVVFVQPLPLLLLMLLTAPLLELSLSLSLPLPKLTLHPLEPPPPPLFFRDLVPFQGMYQQYVEP